MLLLERHFLRHALYRFFGRESLYDPLCAYVYLTYRCNLSCVYCDDGTGVNYPEKQIDRELTTDEWGEVFRILRRETDTVIITGGEPTCRCDLAEILLRIRRLRYRRVCLLTNALLLDENPDVLASVDMLVVSLDTLDSAKGDRMLGSPGVHRRVRKNVELAGDLRRRWGFKLYLSCCIGPDTVDDAGEVLDFAVRQRIGFTPVPVIRGFYPARELVGNPKYEALIQRTIELKRRGGDVLGTMLYLRAIQRFDKFRCQPTLLARVRPNGDVLYPCNMLNTSGGNLLTLGDYRLAIDEGYRRHGSIPLCDNRCHLGCYLDFSLLVQRPWALFYEAYLGLRKYLAFGGHPPRR